MSNSTYKHLIESVSTDYEHKFTNREEIESLFVTTFMHTEELLERNDLQDKCTVHPGLLWTAILDFFEDMYRLWKNHVNNRGEQVDNKDKQNGFGSIHNNKLNAYLIYWLVRNRPIQIDVEKNNINSITENDQKLLHINESIFSYLLINKISFELSCEFMPEIQIEGLQQKLEENMLIKNFYNKLCYNFRYRQYSAQSILLLIEGFTSAALFVLQIT